MSQKNSSEARTSDSTYPGTILQKILEQALNTTVNTRNFVRVKGGFSREIWAFDAIKNEKLHELILCKDGGNGAVDTGRESLSRTEEFTLLQHLKTFDIAVPDVICAGDSFGEKGQPYLIMSRVAGDTDVAQLLNNPFYKSKQHELSRQMATTLAAIHSSPICKELFPNEESDLNNLIIRETERWCRAIESMSGALTPSIAKAIKWLKNQNPPAPKRPVLVHGDYRIGNVIYGKDGIRSILDWELAHIGDPLEDVAWAQLCTWTGSPGGLVTTKEWCNEYSRASEQQIDLNALKYWDVLSIVKMTGLAFRAASKSNDKQQNKFLNRLIEILRNDLDSRLLAT